MTPETKADAEARLRELVDRLDIGLVVLARSMQILSNDLCKQLEGRAINIHHSFPPSFKGARPYAQAHWRGVKLVGATAHPLTPLGHQLAWTGPIPALAGRTEEAVRPILRHQDADLSQEAGARLARPGRPPVTPPRRPPDAPP